MHNGHATQNHSDIHNFAKQSNKHDEPERAKPSPNPVSTLSLDALQLSKKRKVSSYLIFASSLPAFKRSHLYSLEVVFMMELQG
jgi:hypothetical protein